MSRVEQVSIAAVVDVATHTRQQSASWSYPDGAELTRATRILVRSVLGGVPNRKRSALRATTYRRAPLLDGADPALQMYASLRAQTTQFSEAVAAGFGHEVSGRGVVQQGVERRVANTLRGLRPSRFVFCRCAWTGRLPRSPGT